MLHPHTELRYVDGTVGHGVFATARIPAGTFTWVKDPLDRVFTPKQIAGLGTAFEPLVSHCTFADERGCVVVVALESDPALAEVPVVVVSADAMPAQVRRFLDQGAREYLTKPIDVKRLLRVIDECLWPDRP